MSVEKYWKALAAGDGKTMALCYAPDATFCDPVFDLKGAEVGAMWRMLMQGATDLEVSTGPLRWNEGDGDATGTLEARYTFSLTGRRVTNRIHSTFWVRDGLIVRQVDRFPFWRWARQALGWKGVVLGWTPVVRKAVRKQARARLDAFMARGATTPSA
ncbi:MAG: nuclear transport factor 2 family protein [bacterium]